MRAMLGIFRACSIVGTGSMVKSMLQGTLGLALSCVVLEGDINSLSAIRWGPSRLSAGKPWWRPQVHHPHQTWFDHLLAGSFRQLNSLRHSTPHVSIRYGSWGLWERTLRLFMPPLSFDKPLNPFPADVFGHYFRGVLLLRVLRYQEQSLASSYPTPVSWTGWLVYSIRPEKESMHCAQYETACTSRVIGGSDMWTALS